MEFITTKRGARVIVYEGHKYVLDEMDVSSEGVGETGNRLPPMPESRADVHFDGEWTKTASGEAF